MKFISNSLFLFLPVAGLLAQAPPPRPLTPGAQGVALPPNATAAPAVPPDRVIITVGEVRITAAQYNQIVESLPEQVRNAARGPSRREFAQNLVRIFVLADEGRNRKL
ncbi:MAG: hypothetical protein JO323_25335, partial [Acidobacteriia bacterium]|nr:hypothetical protein [Terriglobia bacterium]